MGLLDIITGKYVDPTHFKSVHEGGNIITTTVDSVVNWGRKSSIWPFPFGTACCAIEFMAFTASHYDVARFGSEVLRFSPRQADLLLVAGTIVDKMGPILKTIYDQMPEPKWVVSMGVCASTGGFYRSYHTMQGIDEIIPVDVYVPGCPPTPEALLAALMKIQERIKSGDQTKRPQGEHRVAARAEGVNDRRERRQAWAQDDATRASSGLDPRGRIHFKLTEEREEPGAARTMPSLVAPGLAAMERDLALSKPAYRILSEKFGAKVLHVSDYRGDLAITIDCSVWKEAARTLCHHPELDYKLFLDLCGVDYLHDESRPDRFEVALHLYSISHKHHMRLKTSLPERNPVCDTLTDVYKGANWFEREAFDLYGIVFTGHPNLCRILTHEDFVGHPMRKDFATGKRFANKKPKEWLLSVPKGSEHLVLNIGPSHPAMHGTFRVQALLDGEIIKDAEAEIGYLHRNFEKMAEERTYWQIIPYTDRLNYCSAFINGHGWALAVEKLLGVQAPPRAEAIRVILSELSRIMDHFVCITANVVDLGAITPFFVAFRAREEIYDLLDSVCGARLTVSYVRIGGVAQDVPDDFEVRCRKTMDWIREVTEQMDKLLTRNIIFANRFKDVGVFSKEDALSYGWVGPCLRGSGIGYDVRKDHPYSGYDQYDFDVPVGTVGDCYDRYLVRVEEIKQSLRIIDQALSKLPKGPFITDDRKVALPPKSEVYSDIESLMNHFKLVYDGIVAAPGEVYGYVEGANGELGYYIVSDGKKHPARVKVRPPCYNIYQAYPHMIKGKLIADAVAIIGGLNVVAGELDR